ncbi:hypothetical protein [Commensalibacter communis]|uniref:hypothetical protein n=1 Tax=Commensalibacter communis TaxID=2972786 RepID=UPI0022FF6A81|nr:hypothetical protein [Commensalibacter communis]CAI3958898.1 unnamed protein product [Commensalibacter communis]CAI3959464.1 unnamed protein product [Commensalibacter communis]
MKKILFTLSLLVLPLTAQAQDKADNHYTPELIKAVVDRFAPVFCSGDPEKIVNAVRNCYLTTPLQDQKRLQCLIADSILDIESFRNRMKADGLGIPEANAFAGMNFPTARAYGIRTRALQSTPGFEYVNYKDTSSAMEKATELMHQTSYCKKNEK